VRGAARALERLSGRPPTAYDGTVTEQPSPAEDTAPRHFLVQAPVPALDVDGLTLVIIGTVAFAVASVGLAFFRSQLHAAGHGWWLGVAISGFILGLIGLAYCWDRRRRRRHSLLTDL
jgi:hypothetical protein